MKGWPQSSDTVCTHGHWSTLQGLFFNTYQAESGAQEIVWGVYSNMELVCLAGFPWGLSHQWNPPISSPSVLHLNAVCLQTISNPSRDFLTSSIFIKESWKGFGVCNPRRLRHSMRLDYSLEFSSQYSNDLFCGYNIRADGKRLAGITMRSQDAMLCQTT